MARCANAHEAERVTRVRVDGFYQTGEAWEADYCDGCLPAALRHGFAQPATARQSKSLEPINVPEILAGYLHEYDDLVANPDEFLSPRDYFEASIRGLLERINRARSRGVLIRP